MPPIPRFMTCETPGQVSCPIYILHSEAPRFLARSNALHEPEGFEIITEYEPVKAYFNDDLHKVVLLLAEMRTWYTGSLWKMLQQD